MISSSDYLLTAVAHTPTSRLTQVMLVARTLRLELHRMKIFNDKKNNVKIVEIKKFIPKLSKFRPRAAPLVPSPVDAYTEATVVNLSGVGT